MIAIIDNFEYTNIKSINVITKKDKLQITSLHISIACSGTLNSIQLNTGEIINFNTKGIYYYYNNKFIFISKLNNLDN